MRKKDVIEHFDGSIQRTAEALGITHSAVWQWPETVPEVSAYKLMYLTGGRLRVDPSVYEQRKRQRHRMAPPGKQARIRH